MKKKALVFGSAGFIATYLLDSLIENGYSVVATDISEIGRLYCEEKNICYEHVDITVKEDFKKLQSYEFDVVIHLAAIQPATFDCKKDSQRQYFDVIAVGTLNILDYCKQKNIKKIIYASSHRNTSGLWVNKHHEKIHEDDGFNLELRGEYGMFSLSETAAQHLVEYYANNYGIDGVVFRLPPVYGYGPHLEIFKNGKPIKTGFQSLIEQAKEGAVIEVWGDATVGRDIIYVKDVVSAFLAGIENEGARGLYNITSGYRLTLDEQVKTIIKVFWPKGKEVLVKNLKDKTHYLDDFVYDNTKAKNDFHWKPQFDFESLLRDYEKEIKKGRFDFLIKKRKEMFVN
jgi:UDP-glucose 4-epimerase